MRWISMILAAALLSAACAGGEPAEDTDQDALHSVALADSIFDPTLFDTIEWDEPQEALARGQIVYRHSCLKCHGTRGLGDAGFVQGGDTLRPPSFREPTWRYAGDKEGIRWQTFVGADEGMPHWGLVGLGPRDLDAVAVYILEGFPSQ